VPVEGVVNALREVHAALVPGGLLVDTQPISARPPVTSGDTRLGTLDMQAWRATIDAVDEQLAKVVADGLYVLEDERSIVVTDTYDNGPELVEAVSGWQGTRISPRLSRAATAAAPPLLVHQEVRLRLLRTLAR
jgi:hypothetical protein